MLRRTDPFEFDKRFASESLASTHDDIAGIQNKFTLNVYAECRRFNMTVSRMIALAAVTTLLSVVALAEENEKKIQRSDLPAAVEKTVAEQSQGATIRGFSQETEKGLTYYEAELIVNGHKKDVLMDAKGSVVEVEEQVSIESLPQAVREGLQSKAGTGKIVKVETLNKSGTLVAYEAKVLTNGKKSEVQVGPDGKALDHEE